MWKYGAIAAGVAALALMGSGVTTAGAGAGASTATIRVSERVAEQFIVDQGEPGAGFADEWVLRGRLFNDAGTRIGTDGQSCTQTSANGQALCVLTLSLPGGQIAGQGLVRATDPPSVVRMAVTGGTGRFAGVGGQIRLEPVAADETDIVVRLIHPVGS